jgi:2-polyprenyl-6-methoxyphenol hydroxylase-like FAD-dependent oxidoreductase
VTNDHTPLGRVIIVGAGLGGLCLAQGLAGAGIDVAVYERDESPLFRDQGYRITLKETGARALRECLPDHLFQLSVATAIRQATRMVFTDELLHPKFAKPIPAVEPGESRFGVNRQTLREILLAGLDGVVHFGKTFQCYEQTADGRVLARFADGTTDTGDLLVGADGTNSAVRRQLLPDAEIDELHRLVHGRTPIHAATLDWVPDVLVDTFNLVFGPDGPGAAFSVATCRTREPVTEAAARLAPGLALTDLPSYFSWTVPFPADLPPDPKPDMLHRAAFDLVTGWHPAVRRLIAEADVAATFPIRVTSARPVQPWSTATVTLLGDAIHTMSPGRGDGANVALKDARILRRALLEVAAGRAPLTLAKTAYEQEMLHYGFQAVADSRQHPFSPTRSG